MQKQLFCAYVGDSDKPEDVEIYGCADIYKTAEDIQNDFDVNGYVFAIVDPSTFDWFKIESSYKKVPLKEKKVALERKKVK